MTDVPAPRRNRRWRHLLIVLAVLATLYAGYRYTLHRMVEAKLDAIRTQGYPVTLDELARQYTDVPSENAAEVFEQAFSNYVQLKPGPDDVRTEHENFQYHLVPLAGDAKFPAATEPLSESMKKQVAAYIESNAVSIALLEKAVTMRQCRFHLVFTQAETMSIAHLLGMRRGAAMLMLQAALCVDANDGESASKHLIALLGLARALKDEPLYFSQHTRIYCFSLGKRSLERLLNRVQLTDEQLSSVSGAFGRIEDRDPITRTMIAERCFNINLFQRLQRASWLKAKEYDGFVSGDLNGYDPPVRSLLLYRLLGWLDADFLHYLNEMENVIRATKEGRFLSGTEIVRTPYYSETIRKDRLIAWLFLAQFERQQRAYAAIFAATAMCRTAIAIERYRLAHGVLPNGLDHLSSGYLDAPQKDPFTDRPLRYKKLAEGYVVYSVGKDGVDDGGDEKKDITFTVER